LSIYFFSILKKTKPSIERGTKVMDGSLSLPNGLTTRPEKHL
jgi:hypothetical protein